MFVSPGFPEPLPAEITAVGDPAVTSPTIVRRSITDSSNEPNFLFMSVALDCQNDVYHFMNFQQVQLTVSVCICLNKYEKNHCLI
jgi:hypothetical protein